MVFPSLAGCVSTHPTTSARQNPPFPARLASARLNPPHPAYLTPNPASTRVALPASPLSILPAYAAPPAYAALPLSVSAGKLGCKPQRLQRLSVQLCRASVAVWRALNAAELADVASTGTRMPQTARKASARPRNDSRCECWQSLACTLVRRGGRRAVDEAEGR